MTSQLPNEDDALRQMLGPIMPPSHARRLGHAERIELDTERAIRARNKISYRLNHWPIWIWTFFIAPGPLTFDLFAHGFDWRMAVWLAVVLVVTGIAGVLGKLPGVEPSPYIIRFTEDRPNPLYRRVCYTFGWSAVVTFALRTAFAAGDTAATVEVIALDCAAARFRRTSAATTRRNGEMTGSNEPGAFETYPEGSVMAQIAVPLCERVSGG